MHRETWETEERRLRAVVFEKTWAGELWGPNGAIKFSRMRARILRKLRRNCESFSALSSTYYTAAGNAMARAATHNLFRTLWYTRAVWCAWRAMCLSDAVERRLGPDLMSPDELDVRSRVLFRVRRYQRSLRCSEEALKRKELPPDTEALLEVGMAETLMALGRCRDADDVYDRALALHGQLRPATLVRVERSVGAHFLRTGHPEAGRAVLQAALALAQEHKLFDQIAKIEAALR